MINTFLADLNFNDFDPKKDNIAVVIKEFTLKKKADGPFQRYSEPYIVSMAIDQNGAKNPAIEFNVLPFPNVRKGQKVTFNGQGHLIYGPKNPGEFLAYSILYMESDKDIRKLGSDIKKIVKSEAINNSLQTVLAAAPTYLMAATVLTQLTSLVSVRMQQNRDDELYRQNGTLLRDVSPPYDILRTYTEQANDFIAPVTSILPLVSSNNLGKHCTKIMLQ